MKDILSVASLFLAFLGLLYNAWYPEISNVVKVKKRSDFKEDNNKIASEVMGTLCYKALPITFFSFALSFILLPEMIRINLKETLINYDVVKLLFCVIEIFSIFFTIHLIILSCRLFRRYRKMRE